MFEKSSNKKPDLVNILRSIYRSTKNNDTVKKLILLPIQRWVKHRNRLRIVVTLTENVIEGIGRLDKNLMSMKI